jgi:hypothetical protein
MNGTSHLTLGENGNKYDYNLTVWYMCEVPYLSKYHTHPNKMWTTVFYCIYKKNIILMKLILKSKKQYVLLMWAELV